MTSSLYQAPDCFVQSTVCSYGMDLRRSPRAIGPNFEVPGTNPRTNPRTDRGQFTNSIVLHVPVGRA
eukprot:3126357-Rhodomonas_salina.3